MERHKTQDTDATISRNNDCPPSRNNYVAGSLSQPRNPHEIVNAPSRESSAPKTSSQVAGYFLFIYGSYFPLRNDQWPNQGCSAAEDDVPLNLDQHQILQHSESGSLAPAMNQNDVIILPTNEDFETMKHNHKSHVACHRAKTSTLRSQSRNETQISGSSGRNYGQRSIAPFSGSGLHTTSTQKNSPYFSPVNDDPNMRNDMQPRPFSVSTDTNKTSQWGYSDPYLFSLPHGLDTFSQPTTLETSNVPPVYESHTTISPSSDMADLLDGPISDFDDECELDIDFLRAFDDDP
jgi:hypothetical protein